MLLSPMLGWSLLHQPCAATCSVSPPGPDVEVGVQKKLAPSFLLSRGNGAQKPRKINMVTEGSRNSSGGGVGSVGRGDE